MSGAFTDVWFDFFGTLVEYDPSVHTGGASAPQAFAARHGSSTDATEAWDRAWAEHEDRAVRTGREYSMLQVASRFTDLLGVACGLDEHQRLVDEYLAAWTAPIRVRSGAVEALASLSQTHRVIVVSNTHDERLVPQLLERHGLADHVTAVVLSVSVGWRKPHPNLFAEALRRHPVPADRIAFVGDTWDADVDGPRRAGMTPFYVGAPAADRPTVPLPHLPALIHA